MTYFAKVWTRGSTVHAVQTDELLNDHESMLDWSDFVYTLAIEGEFVLADIVHNAIQVSGESIKSDSLSFAILEKKVGRQNVMTESELQAAREKMKLSFAQLLIGLVSEAFITEQEGDLWLQGQLPQPVLAIIDTLPLASRFAAKVKATRPSEVLRADKIVWAMADSKGMTPEQLDQFFIKYSAV